MPLTTFLEGESLSASCLPTRPSPLSTRRLNAVQARSHGLLDSTPLDKRFTPFPQVNGGHGSRVLQALYESEEKED